MATMARNTTRRKTTSTKLKPDTVISRMDRNGKQKVDSRRAETLPSTPEQDKVAAMRAVNASLQTLSSVVQSGWKASQTDTSKKPDAIRGKMDNAVEDAGRALEKLRRMCPEDMDVERAASSLIGKLLALELHETATEVLIGVHSHLMDQMKGLIALQSPLHLLSLPLSVSTDATITTLALTTLTYALNALITRLLHSALLLRDMASVLQNNTTLLDWAQYAHRNSILEKTRDTLLTRTYTSLTKVCSTLSTDVNTLNREDLQSIFYLRIYALSCLLYTSPGTIKPSTFWEQLQKACLIR
ncbi:hypothetical protein J3A83DRAFT_4211529 [Scleroderma citrinum]